MLTTIQIFLLIFIMFAASRVILRVKDGTITVRTSIFWLALWVLATIGILLPATTSKIASVFGVGRGVDVIVYSSLAIIFYLVFRLYVIIEDLRHEITFLVRKIALKNSSNSTPKPPAKSRNK